MYHLCKKIETSLLSWVLAVERLFINVSKWNFKVKSWTKKPQREPGCLLAFQWKGEEIHYRDWKCGLHAKTLVEQWPSLRRGVIAGPLRLRVLGWTLRHLLMPPIIFNFARTFFSFKVKNVYWTEIFSLGDVSESLWVLFCFVDKLLFKNPIGLTT